MLSFKAGMEGVDRNMVSKIVAENTSANYSMFTSKQQERIDKRVSEIKEKLGSVSEVDMKMAERETDNLIARLESWRDLDRHCVHIDMDAYFAAVEMRDESRLRSIPMAVGSSSMLGTSNYLARKYGVRAAMPGFIAKKLCPELEIVPGDYAKYGRESKIFSAIFASYDADMSMGSLDEAYIDITDYMATRTESVVLPRIRYGGDCICRLPLIKEEEISETLKTEEISCKKCQKKRISYEDTVEFGTTRAEIVREMRFKVEQATGLTCSAGIAANFMLAKICSDLNKPNGQYELDNDYDKIMSFLKDLPIRKVSGIGRVSEAHLAACGISTVGDILTHRGKLKFVFSNLSQESFIRVGLGLPGRHRSDDPKRKSISYERTFTPTNSESELMQILQNSCEHLIDDMLRSGITGGRCVAIKLKMASFDVMTRCMTMPNVVKTTESLYKAASELLVKEFGPEFRLLGVRLSNLEFKDSPTAKTDQFRSVPNKIYNTKINNNNNDEVMDFFQTAPPKRARITLDSEDVEEEQKPSTSSTTSADTVKCPICQQSIQNDVKTVNMHVDICLNSQFLTTDRQSTNKPDKDNRKRAKTNTSITRFFNVK